MRTAKLYDYIPEPEPVQGDYLNARYYYPGWQKGGIVAHNRFDDLRDNLPDYCVPEMLEFGPYEPKAQS